MSKIKELGQYPTPVWVAEALVERHFSRLDASDLVIEPSCGPGAFLQALPAHVPALGVEIDVAMAELARQHTGRQIILGDFRTVSLQVQPTLILGNPPFNLKLVDAFLERAFALLPSGGRVGFILPAFAFQTAGRVARYAEQWSLKQELIPRNIYPGLSLPLLFALFSKDQRRTMVGFALYKETVDMHNLAPEYRTAAAQSYGPVWCELVSAALTQLGGEASIQDIYDEISRRKPTLTRFWKEKVRQTVRRYATRFQRVKRGRYRLWDDPELKLAA